MRQKTQHTLKLGSILGLLALPLFLASSVSANQITSPNYTIDTSVIGASLAGPQMSTNYSLVSSGGESVIGDGTSGSYKLGEGYIKTLEQSLQLTLQPDGLRGYWPLDNSAPAAVALDESVYGNDGVYSAGSISIIGQVGQAFNDSIGTQYISIPHSNSIPTSGDKMTITGWILPGNTTAEKAIITKWDFPSQNGSWALQTAPGNTQLRMFMRDSTSDDGNYYVDSTDANMAQFTWYHVAMVYDGSQALNADKIKLYVNGTQLTTTVSGVLPTSIVASTSPLVIGDFPGLSRNWTGGLDEIKLYDRVLTQAELVAQYGYGVLGLAPDFGFTNLIAGVSQVAPIDTFVQTDAPGYSLAINQNNDLTSGGFTIPAVSGSIASPTLWTEGTTKGLGFTLFGTNATALPGTWNSGNSYAALPGSSTSFYTRTGYTGGQKDKLNMRLRLDVPTTQGAALYQNQMTVTGTMTP